MTSSEEAMATANYSKWIELYDNLTPDLLIELQDRANKLKSGPLISIIMPVFDPCLEDIRCAINSVESQIYDRWELCIANDASTDPNIRKYLDHCEHRNSRIRVINRVVNGHISAVSNSALSLAGGDFVAFLDQDDMLSAHALLLTAEAINLCPDVGLIYSDEDKIDAYGNRVDPHFKPDWNIDLFRSINVIGHLSIYRRSLVNEVGGFRTGFEGAQDYDLALRCVERLRPEQITHIPFVLYHWRSPLDSSASSIRAKHYALEAGSQAIAEHLRRSDIAGDVEIINLAYRVRYSLPSSRPVVALIVPTRDKVGLLKQCIDGIFNNTIYPSYEIIIVDNGSREPATHDYLDSLKSDCRIRILRDDLPFNYSRLNNEAVTKTTAELVCLMNNDVEPINPDWLHELVSLAIRPEVGAVGARLWYPNMTLQHGGVILGLGGIAGHAHKRFANENRGYFGRAALLQAFSAVTGACLMVRRKTYVDAGGLDEVNLTVAFNDVDFCLRVARLGLRNLWTPYAELFHHESASRGSDETPANKRRFGAEQEYMQAVWGDRILNDPAYNPNLTFNNEDFSLAFPPRVSLGHQHSRAGLIRP